MISEAELSIPALKVLAGAPNGAMSTRELRERLKKALPLTPADCAPLVGRADTKIDQRIRNLKSHSKSPGNIIREGYAKPIRGGFQITKHGRGLLKKK